MYQVLAALAPQVEPCYWHLLTSRAEPRPAAEHRHRAQVAGGVLAHDKVAPLLSDAYSGDADQSFRRIPIRHSDRKRSVRRGCVTAPLDASTDLSLR